MTPSPPKPWEATSSVSTSSCPVTTSLDVPARPQSISTANRPGTNLPGTYPSPHSYGSTMYGNSMYGNSMYGTGYNSMYGNSMYGNGYGNSMYGNSMYGNSMYGNSMYGGYGGYGNRYGSSPYRPGFPPMGVPGAEMSIGQTLEQSTQRTFQTLEQIVQAFGGNSLSNLFFKDSLKCLNPPFLPLIPLLWP
jgi:peroxin-13